MAEGITEFEKTHLLETNRLATQMNHLERVLKNADDRQIATEDATMEDATTVATVMSRVAQDYLSPGADGGVVLTREILDVCRDLPKLLDSPIPDPSLTARMLSRRNTRVVHS